MSLVKSFTHLKGRPHEEKALPTLQRIASLVKPIMRKHSWTLQVLSEFFPENDSLVGLNVNKGQKILLRLRPAWAPDTFYDDDQLALVMLHELTHNVHGPHNNQFYALLATLEKEYEALRRSGYAGEGFHGPGARVGIGVSHNLPPHLARQRALEAAEKRRATAATMRGGGRLGGRAVHGKTPRELAADAAERRAWDEKSCASGRVAEAEKEAQRAVQDSVVDVIDVDAESPPYRDQTPSTDVAVIDGPSSSSVVDVINVDAESPLSSDQPPSADVAVIDESSTTVVGESIQKPRISTSPSNPLPLASSNVMDEWVCPVCTLLNTSLALQCAACYTPRRTESWTCLACGETGMPHDFWTCRACGRVKSES